LFLFFIILNYIEIIRIEDWFNMTEVLGKHKFMLIVLSLIILITFLAVALLLRKPEKIPSKGIFVMDTFSEKCERDLSAL